MQDQRDGPGGDDGEDVLLSGREAPGGRGEGTFVTRVKRVMTCHMCQECDMSHVSRES